MNYQISIPVSTGELFDKISILEIKLERLLDENKLANVRHEIALLQDLVAKSELSTTFSLAAVLPRLKAVNTQIWEAEDKIRDCERRGDFTAEFLEVARSIYHLNDARAAVKREINLLTASPIVEEKSYVSYVRETTV